MDLEKHGDSDASKQEHENQAEKPNDDNTGVGRSYECTFCKRGFTNAQALGGHMNIHRKDKAKAKAKQTNLEEPSNKSKENHTNLRLFMSSPDHQQQIGHQRAVGAHMHYQVYLPSSNPSFQAENSLPLRRPDLSDVNLRLGMGTSPPADGDRVDSNVKESEVDLELRLGHDP